MVVILHAVPKRILHRYDAWLAMPLRGMGRTVVPDPPLRPAPWASRPDKLPPSGSGLAADVPATHDGADFKWSCHAASILPMPWQIYDARHVQRLVSRTITSSSVFNIRWNPSANSSGCFTVRWRTLLSIVPRLQAYLLVTMFDQHPQARIYFRYAIALGWGQRRWDILLGESAPATGHKIPGISSSV